MRSLIVFLDASVILSGLASKTGGSRKILAVGKREKLNLVTTTLVIQQVVKHLQKLAIDLHKLKDLLSTKAIQIISDPPPKIIVKFRQTITCSGLVKLDT